MNQSNLTDFLSIRLACFVITKAGLIVEAAGPFKARQLATNS